MKRTYAKKLVCACVIALGLSGAAWGWETPIPLPNPESADADIDSALATRHSTRAFTKEPLEVKTFSTILGAAYGMQPDGGRTVPSAGALYPLDIFFFARNISGINPGFYRYRPKTHDIVRTGEAAPDSAADIRRAALGQRAFSNAAAVLLVCTRPERVAQRYGQKAMDYIFIETGALCQNAGLYCAATDTGTVVIGAFDEDMVKSVFGINDTNVRVLCLMPMGRIES